MKSKLIKLAVTAILLTAAGSLGLNPEQAKPLIDLVLSNVQF